MKAAKRRRYRFSTGVANKITITNCGVSIMELQAILFHWLKRGVPSECTSWLLDSVMEHRTFEANKLNQCANLFTWLIFVLLSLRDYFTFTTTAASIIVEEKGTVSHSHVHVVRPLHVRYERNSIQTVNHVRPYLSCHLCHSLYA